MEETRRRHLAALDQARFVGAVVGHRVVDRSHVVPHQQVAHFPTMAEAVPRLRLVLDKASWFLREGEIVLNLFVNDQRFYSIAFTLGVDGGEPLIFVGALQGSNVDTAQEVYKDITRALDGMRPRDFLMVALKLLCGELGINRIWAVSSDNRQHNSPYFGKSHKEKVLVAYNEVWLEHGGRALGDSFFEMPITIKEQQVRAGGQLWGLGHLGKSIEGG